MAKVEYIQTNRIPYQKGERVEGFWPGELLVNGKFTIEFPMSTMKGGICQGELILTNKHAYFELKTFVFSALNHREDLSGFLKIPFRLLQDVQTSSNITLKMEDKQGFTFRISVGMQDVAGILLENFTKEEKKALQKTSKENDEKTSITCPKCEHKMLVPAQGQIEMYCTGCRYPLVIQSGKVISPSPDEKVEVPCLNCQAKIKIPAFKSQEIKCGQCKTAFIANNGRLQYANQLDQREETAFWQERPDFTYQDFVLRQAFLLNDDQFVMDIDISSNLYQYFHQKELEFRHMYAYQGQPLDEYYQTVFGFFWKDPNEIELLERVLRSLESLVHKSGGHYLLEEMLVAYVQGAIEYDHDKVAFKDSKTNHPYETICSARGVCRDTAILMVKLLNILGYDATMIIFPSANHAGVGLKVPPGEGSYRDGQGVEYCYIETTSYWRIGDLPDEYAGTTYLQEQAPLFIYSQGNGYDSFNQIAEYRRERKPIISRIWDSLFG